MQDSNQLSIAVIGAGTISQSVHLISLQRAGFEIAIVCDLSPSRADLIARRVGARAVTDPLEVMKSNVDAVLIATPGSHAQLAELAIRHGKHVLAEKPVAFTMREVDVLERLAQAHRVVAQVGYQKMFDPLLETARQEFSELTGVRLIRVTVMHPADEPQISHLRISAPEDDADISAIQASVKYDRERASEALPGSSRELQDYYTNVLNGSVIHELSLLRAMGVSLPDSWRAEVVTPLNSSAPASLLATAVSEDTAFLLSWNWLPEYPEYVEEISVLADNGRLEFQLAKPYLLEARSLLTSRRHNGDLRKDTSFRSGHETGFLRQLDAFRRAILNGERNSGEIAGAKDDIRHLQLLAKAIGASLGERVGTEATEVES